MQKSLVKLRREKPIQLLRRSRKQSLSHAVLLFKVAQCARSSKTIGQSYNRFFGKIYSAIHFTALMHWSLFASVKGQLIS